MAHATRSPNRRQECCERGYYYLHRQLDDLLFLHTIFRFFFGGAVVPLRFFGGAGVRGSASTEAGGARLLFRQKTPHLVYSRTSVPPYPRAPET